MSERTVARRYARALYEEALDAGTLEEVDAGVDLIRVSFSDSRELVRFFASPIISREKKTAIVESLFEQRVSPLTLRFMHLLVEKEREAILPTVVQVYRELQDEHEGIVEATATVPFPLKDQDRDRIHRSVEALTGKRVRMLVKQDPSIIGGIVVRVGDTVYDGSVHQQLENLREQLHGQRVGSNGAATLR